jgi:prevent-host-death family protein
MTTIENDSSDETVSAAEANRRFSSILRGVRDGCSYTITSHGRPVARLVPPVERTTVAARDLLLARLAAQPAIEIGRWTRDALYEDDA